MIQRVPIISGVLGYIQTYSGDVSEKLKQISVREVLRTTLHYAFVPISLAYMEILLRLLCGYDFLPGLHYALLKNFIVGFVISAIALIINKRTISRIVAATLLGICCLINCFEYFMYSTYKVFMSFDTVLAGVGHVVGEFSSTIVSTITSGIPVIIAFFLPLAIFIFFTGKIFPFETIKKQKRIARLSTLVYVASMFIIFGMIIVNQKGGEQAAYYTEYNFDNSSRRLGIMTGLGLDIRYSIFGNNSTDAVFVMDVPSLDLQQLPIPPRLDDLNTPEPTHDNETMMPISDTTDSEDEPEPQPPVEYGYNEANFDFETIIANESNQRIRAITEYIASISASRQSEYTGIFEGKNLILITAEGFNGVVVDPVMTPTLYRLVHSGLYFSDYYQPAWGGSTSSGEYSVLTGLAPVSGSRNILMAANQNLSYAISNKLTALGYLTASYHNGSHTYYNRDNTHTKFGYSYFMAIGSGMEGQVPHRWPISDLDMMEFSLPHYIDNQPFSVYYMTISGHATYSRAFNAMSDKNWDAFPEQYSLMSNTIRAYHAANLELEYALQYIVEQLEAAGIINDTVIALSADHYPYGLDWSESWGTDREYLSELFGHRVETSADRDQNALIIWSGCLENEYAHLSTEISSPTFSLDILPTLLNLFGLEFDSRMFAGRDIFSDAMPLVFWLDRSWKTDYGYYHAPRGLFTPADGIEFPEDMIDEYVESIKTIVSNRLNYSDAVTAYDYFNVLYYPDGTVRMPLGMDSLSS